MAYSQFGKVGVGTSGGYGSGGGFSGGGGGAGIVEGDKNYTSMFDQFGNRRSYGSAGGAGSKSGAPSSISIPQTNQPQMPYKPEGPQVQNLIDPLAAAGKGLLDPGSEYSKKMRGELWEDIGDKTAAQQRSAALMAARSGMGVGASPELLETQADIGRGGLEAYGDASAQSVLGGMQLGGSMLSPALQSQLGLQGQQLQGFMGQQQLNADQQAMQFQAALQQQQLQQQRELAEQEMMLRELAFTYGAL